MIVGISAGVSVSALVVTLFTLRGGREEPKLDTTSAPPSSPPNTGEKVITPTSKPPTSSPAPQRRPSRPASAKAPMKWGRGKTLGVIFGTIALILITGFVFLLETLFGLNTVDLAGLGILFGLIDASPALIMWILKKRSQGYVPPEEPAEEQTTASGGYRSDW